MVLIDKFIYSYIVENKQCISYLTRRTTTEKRTIPASKSDPNGVRAARRSRVLRSIELCFFCAFLSHIMLIFGII